MARLLPIAVALPAVLLDVAAALDVKNHHHNHGELPLNRRQLLVNVPLATATAASTNAAAAAAPPPLSCLEDSSRIRLPRSNNVCLPRIGYSLYKTVPEQVAEGVGLALQAGVCHFDCATLYGTNAVVGSVLKRYLDSGRVETQSQGVTQSPLSGRQKRQAAITVSHKVSNAEQSLSTRELQRAVLQQARVLGKTPLDLVLIHSPLTDANRRLSTYAALCELQAQQKIGTVGVCHFGVQPLQELVDAGLPPPSLIQLELSPFNQHRDVCDWATAHESLLGCAAWSKLSSVNGPTQGWDVLGKVAAARGLTKQQAMIRWAVQRGYLCVPRSSSQYKVERAAIRENSWAATADVVLTDEEMATLNGLDVSISARQLGVLDGWDASDIAGPTWDPTTAVV